MNTLISWACIIGLVLSIIYNFVNGRMLKKETKKLVAAVKILNNIDPNMATIKDSNTGGVENILGVISKISLSDSTPCEVREPDNNKVGTDVNN